MSRVLLAVGLLAVAVLVAWLAARRRPDAPTQPLWNVPTQLDRRDFARPDAAWLVAVFTSATCSACHDVWDKARHLESDAVAVQELEAVAEGEVHSRYGIDAVPLVVIADAEGVVRGHFLGPVTATDLWARVAEVREPGTLPGECQKHQTGS